LTTPQTQRNAQPVYLLAKGSPPSGPTTSGPTPSGPTPSAPPSSAPPQNITTTIPASPETRSSVLTEDFHEKISRQLISTAVTLAKISNCKEDPIILRHMIRHQSFREDNWHMSIINNLFGDFPSITIDKAEWIIDSNLAKKYYETKEFFRLAGKDTSERYICHGTPAENIEPYTFSRN
jgi:hypothetical protein